MTFRLPVPEHLGWAKHSLDVVDDCVALSQKRLYVPNGHPQLAKEPRTRMHAVGRQGKVCNAVRQRRQHLARPQEAPRPPAAPALRAARPRWAQQLPVALMQESLAWPAHNSCGKGACAQKLFMFHHPCTHGPVEERHWPLGASFTLTLGLAPSSSLTGRDACCAAAAA